MKYTNNYKSIKKMSENPNKIEFFTRYQNSKVILHFLKFKKLVANWLKLKNIVHFNYKFINNYTILSNIKIVYGDLDSGAKLSSYLYLYKIRYTKIFNN